MLTPCFDGTAGTGQAAAAAAEAVPPPKDLQSKQMRSKREEMTNTRKDRSKAGKRGEVPKSGKEQVKNDGLEPKVDIDATQSEAQRVHKMEFEGASTKSIPVITANDSPNVEMSAQEGGIASSSKKKSAVKFQAAEALSSSGTL